MRKQHITFAELLIRYHSYMLDIEFAEQHPGVLSDGVLSAILKEFESMTSLFEEALQRIADNPQEPEGWAYLNSPE